MTLEWDNDVHSNRLFVLRIATAQRSTPEEKDRPTSRLSTHANLSLLFLRKLHPFASYNLDKISIDYARNTCVTTVSCALPRIHVLVFVHERVLVYLASTTQLG